jgi:hypothetical protein
VSPIGPSSGSLKEPSRPEIILRQVASAARNDGYSDTPHRNSKIVYNGAVATQKRACSRHCGESRNPEAGSQHRHRPADAQPPLVMSLDAVRFVIAVAYTYEEIIRLDAQTLKPEQTH